MAKFKKSKKNVISKKQEQILLYFVQPKIGILAFQMAIILGGGYFFFFFQKFRKILSFIYQNQRLI